jgi:hypothetical protein
MATPANTGMKTSSDDTQNPSPWKQNHRAGGKPRKPKAASKEDR